MTRLWPILLGACGGPVDAPAPSEPVPTCEPATPAPDAIVAGASIAYDSYGLREQHVYGMDVTANGIAVLASQNDLVFLDLAGEEPGVFWSHQVGSKGVVFGGQGDMAYVHDGARIRVIDLSTGDPTVVGHYSVRDLRALAATGDAVYAITSTDLHLLDESRIWAAALDGGAPQMATTARDGVFYIADLESGLIPVDASTPDQVVVGSALGGPAHHAERVGDVVVVSRGNDGIEVYEVGEPMTPRLVAQLDVGGSALASAPLSDHQVAISAYTELISIDLSDPARPSVLARQVLDDPIVAMSISAVGNTVWLPNREEIARFDIAEFAAPALVTTLDVAEQADGGLLEVTNRGGATLWLDSILDQGGDVLVEAESIEPGTTLAVEVDVPQEVCLSTSDPDTPALVLDVVPQTADYGLAPDFELPSTSGETLRLYDHRGTPVLLSFFGSWCPRCIEDLPEIEAMYSDYAGDVEVWAIDVEESSEIAEAVAQSLGLTMPMLLDDDGAVFEQYQDEALHPFPLDILVDGDGQIVYRGSTVAGNALRDALDEVLSP